MGASASVDADSIASAALEFADDSSHAALAGSLQKYARMRKTGCAKHDLGQQAVEVLDGVSEQDVSDFAHWGSSGGRSVTRRGAVITLEDVRRLFPEFYAEGVCGGWSSSLSRWGLCADSNSELSMEMLCGGGETCSEDRHAHK